jgi:Concanavalin A-like lectin/glucanases superfamily
MKKFFAVLTVSFLTFSASFAAEGLKPVLDFNFQKTVKNTVVSVSGKGIAGAVSGKMKIVDDSKFGKCMEFDKGTFVTVAEDKLPALDKNFTVSVNAKINHFKGWKAFAAKESWNAKTGWFILNYSETLRVFVNSKTVFSVKSPFLDKKWHNLTVVFTDGKVIVYVDGKKIGEKDAVIKANKVPLYFGARHGNAGKRSTDHLQKSFMTDIKVFDKALSAEEVKGLIK